MRLRSMFAGKSLAVVALATASTAYLANHKRNWFVPVVPVHCWGNSSSSEVQIQALLNQAILIKQNGEVVGVAYCVAPDIFVTSRYLLLMYYSPEVFQAAEGGLANLFECFKDSFRFSHPEVVGRYDNLTFLKIKDVSCCSNLRPQLCQSWKHRPQCSLKCSF